MSQVQVLVGVLGGEVALLHQVIQKPGLLLSHWSPSLSVYLFYMVEGSYCHAHTHGGTENNQFLFKDVAQKSHITVLSSKKYQSHDHFQLQGNWEMKFLAGKRLKCGGRGSSCERNEGDGVGSLCPRSRPVFSPWPFNSAVMSFRVPQITLRSCPKGNGDACG